MKFEFDNKDREILSDLITALNSHTKSMECLGGILEEVSDEVTLELNEKTVNNLVTTPLRELTTAIQRVGDKV